MAKREQIFKVPVKLKMTTIITIMLVGLVMIGGTLAYLYKREVWTKTALDIVDKRKEVTRLESLIKGIIEEKTFANDTQMETTHIASKGEEESKSQYDIGYELYDQRRWNEARDELRKVAEIQGAHPFYIAEAQLCIGYSFYEENNYKDAIREFKKVTEMQEAQKRQRIDALRKMASSYDWLGKNDERDKVCMQILTTKDIPVQVLQESLEWIDWLNVDEKQKDHVLKILYVNLEEIIKKCEMERQKLNLEKEPDRFYEPIRLARYLLYQVYALMSPLAKDEIGKWKAKNQIE